MGTLRYVYVDTYLNNSVHEIIYYTHHNKNASQGVLRRCKFCELKSRERFVTHIAQIWMLCIMHPRSWRLHCPVYRVSQEEWTKLRESVPYVKI